MTATLREAAQALALAVERVAYLHLWKEECARGWSSDLLPEVQALVSTHDAVLGALASPEPDRWTEGAEAMRRALADYHEMQATEADGMNSDGILDKSIAYHDREKKRILATPIPVPPATTAPDPWPPHRMAVGSGKVAPDGRVQPDEAAKPCGCGAPAYRWHRSTPLCTHMQAPAPEAKPAESEVGWIVRPCLGVNEPRGLLKWTLRPSLADARRFADQMIAPAPSEIVRVRVTVEPAPVEPEGAKGAKP